MAEFQRRNENFVQFHFNGGCDKGGSTICFDNLEVTRDVRLFENCFPEIYKSAGGVATAIAKKQPRRVSFPIKLKYAQTIGKLNHVVAMAGGRYRLVVQINGYYDVFPGPRILCCGDTKVKGQGTTGTTAGFIGNLLDGGSLGVVGNPGNLGGQWVLTGGTVGTGNLGALLGTTGAGDAAPTLGTADDQTLGAGSGPGGGAAPGDWVVVNGGAIQLDDQLLAKLQGCVVLVPFAMNAVIEFPPDFNFRQLGQGQGLRHGETVDLMVHETQALTIPTVVHILDPNPIGIDPGNLSTK